MKNIIILLSILLLTNTALAELDLSGLGDPTTKYCVVQIAISSGVQIVGQTCRGDQVITPISDNTEEKLSAEQIQIQILERMRVKGYRLIAVSNLGDIPGGRRINITFEKK